MVAEAWDDMPKRPKERPPNEEGDTIKTARGRGAVHWLRRLWRRLWPSRQMLLTRKDWMADFQGAEETTGEAEHASSGALVVNPVLMSMIWRADYAFPCGL